MEAPLTQLLSAPRETLVVLRYLSKRPRVPPRRAAKDLRIGINTWYLAVSRLEDLELLVGVRAPGGKKVRHYEVSRAGEELLAVLAKMQPLIENSRAALLWELDESPPLYASPRAGEILCRLIESAERRADFEELESLSKRARGMGRPGEALLGAGVGLFLQGETPAAMTQTNAAVKKLAADKGSRSYRKALLVQAALTEYGGNANEAFRLLTQMRTLAMEAGDRAMESDANLGLGILKGRLGQYADAAKFMGRGVKVANAAGLHAKEAKMLANLTFIEFFVDLDSARVTGERALEAARRSGAKIVVARTQLNRALILAAMGEKRNSLAALKEARALFREGGEERGPHSVDEWARLIRRTLRRHHTPYLADLRDQVSRLVKSFPSQTPGEPQE